MSRLVVLLFLCFLQNPGWAQPELLGRLFFTPQQRAMLDRQRQMDANFNPDAMLNEGRLTLNGEVRRNGKHGTRWINGEAIPSEALASPNIPVGDTFLPQTGERESLIGQGKILIKPQRPSP